MAMPCPSAHASRTMPVMPAAGSVWPTFALPLPAASGASSGSRFARTAWNVSVCAMEYKYGAIATLEHGSEAQRLAADGEDAEGRPRLKGVRVVLVVEVFVLGVEERHVVNGRAAGGRDEQRPCAEVERRTGKRPAALLKDGVGRCAD